MAKRPISYTSRDFESIKASLVDHAKRYYPDTYKDFNDASFGSLLLDSVAYIGDQLSFYLDYQTNESFLDTALERSNIERLSRQLGYRDVGTRSSTGVMTFFMLVPTSANGSSPDLDYLPILKKNTEVVSDSGTSFILTEDIDFSSDQNEFVVARQNSETGNPTFFAVKAFGNIVSGELRQELLEVGAYTRFLQLTLEDTSISEIVSVKDSEGNEYFEVPYLSQDVVFDQVPNYGADKSSVPYTLRTRPVPRRYTVDFEEGETIIQFGYGSEESLTNDEVADPADVTLQRFGKNYVSDDSFDPTKLLRTDKFGVVPANTVLTVTYRVNTTSNVNAAANTVTTVINPLLVFKDRPSLESSKISIMTDNIECTNEDSILGDITTPTVDEVRLRAYDYFATQNRAVTTQDYIALSYRMPNRFGSVKRVNVVRDPDSLKRNLNMYVLSEDSDGRFTEATQNLKNNLKNWITEYKMVNDTIDILDGKIVNLEIKFEVIGAFDLNKYDVLRACLTKLKDKLKVPYGLGEALYITEITKHLNSVSGVIDVISVQVKSKTGSGYSQFPFIVKNNLSRDGRVLTPPQNVAFEFYDLDADIIGVVK
jgi:hypothetical protein|tara:strand:+ start:3636 stop:5423 length:1788 start_codon:yes stop_codon:yes gene_type:complete